MEFAPGLRLVDYDPAHERELVAMWRASFERAVGVTDPHPVAEQAAYLREKVVPHHRVRVVLDDSGRVVAFLAANEETIAHLYVHVDHQRRGIGSRLVELAKRESGGSLRLFTFESNVVAQRFYERHGFRVVNRGFEPEWRLPDLEYHWPDPTSCATGSS
jgi:ribosomal protein S18 acetylase RimI-like enzyme